jgi:hypothetical protein
MTARVQRRRKTTLAATKAELLEGRHVIDITDERMAARRRDDHLASLGPLSSIHQQPGDQDAGFLSRLRGRLTGGRHAR